MRVNASRPTSAAVPERSGGGCLTWRLAMGRTTAIPAIEPIAKTAAWTAKGRPSAPVSPAASAATARMPSANVSVSSSAIPSSAATSNQATHGSIAAP